jgi:hypothetical protein
MIEDAIAEGGYYGMQTFDQHLLELYRDGEVSLRDALAAATNPHDFRVSLRGAGPGRAPAVRTRSPAAARAVAASGTAPSKRRRRVGGQGRDPGDVGEQARRAARRRRQRGAAARSPGRRRRPTHRRSASARSRTRARAEASCAGSPPVGCAAGGPRSPVSTAAHARRAGPRRGVRCGSSRPAGCRRRWRSRPPGPGWPRSPAR